MALHFAKIIWKRETQDFSYETYNRDHEWQFEGGIAVKASAAPAYKGNPNAVDPEEAFVASLSSCHMLTFLALAAYKKVVVNAYEDRAEGILEIGKEGKLCLTRVTLNPVVTLDNSVDLSEEMFLRMHDKAHRECFISNSVKTEITVKPKVLGSRGAPAEH